MLPWLATSNVGHALARLDGADMRTTDMWAEANNRAYVVTIVNEPGLYSLILRSR
ncbi:MAG: hypothetical protein ACRDQ5_22470 [Sciscionella sp.]